MKRNLSKFMSNNLLNKKGFSLIELLIVISILGVISTLILDFVVLSFKATRFEAEEAEAIKNARDGMNTMKMEIRGANSSAQGDYPLSTIDDQEFIFFSDIDKDDLYERVRYYLDDLELKKDVTKPGPSNNYTGTTTTITIANYVNNQDEAIFKYYSSEHTITDNINQTRLININLKINVTPEIAPADVYVETDVTLRNLKSNL